MHVDCPSGPPLLLYDLLELILGRRQCHGTIRHEGSQFLTPNGRISRGPVKSCKKKHDFRTVKETAQIASLRSILNFYKIDSRCQRQSLVGPLVRPKDDIKIKLHAFLPIATTCYLSTTLPCAAFTTTSFTIAEIIACPTGWVRASNRPTCRPQKDSLRKSH